MVTQRWHDKEFEKRVLDPRIVNFLTRLGLRGEAIAKELISGVLKAVDTGTLRSRLTYAVKPKQLLVRVGIGITDKFAEPIFYAIYVFLGTAKMPARPVLRRMLMMLKAEFRG